MSKIEVNSQNITSSDEEEDDGAKVRLLNLINGWRIIPNKKYIVFMFRN